MRVAAINLRALPEQRDLIDYAAKLLGKNRSDFMLEAACERAQSVLLDQVFFGLDTEKFKQFTAMLDAPPSANVGLEGSAEQIVFSAMARRSSCSVAGNRSQSTRGTSNWRFVRPDSHDFIAFAPSQDAPCLSSAINVLCASTRLAKPNRENNWASFLANPR